MKRNDATVARLKVRWCDHCNERKPREGFHRGRCSDCLWQHLQSQPPEVLARAAVFALKRLSGQAAMHLRAMIRLGESFEGEAAIDGDEEQAIQQPPAKGGQQPRRSLCG